MELALFIKVAVAMAGSHLLQTSTDIAKIPAVIHSNNLHVNILMTEVRLSSGEIANKIHPAA